jgi:hypothetical protein
MKHMKHNNSKAINLILLINIALTYISCNPFDINKNDDLKVFNNSDTRVYFDWRSEYPDTTLNKTDPQWVGPYNSLPWSENGLNPNETKVIRLRGSWEDCFADNIPSDTIMVYIIDADVLENVYWDTIVKNYMILKRYDLSLQDLEDMNWTITYP